MTSVWAAYVPLILLNGAVLCQFSDSGRLGVKRERYLCAMPTPFDFVLYNWRNVSQKIVGVGHEPWIA